MKEEGILLSQIDLVNVIFMEIAKQYPKYNASTRQYNSVIEAANLVCASFNKSPQYSENGMGIREWLLSDDTGMSSLFIASIYFPKETGIRDKSFPWDPADFGRCYRLMRATGIENLELMAAQSDTWRAFVNAWSELTALYEEETPNHKGSAPKLYARMQQVIGLNK